MSAKNPARERTDTEYEGGEWKDEFHFQDPPDADDIAHALVLLREQVESGDLSEEEYERAVKHLSEAVS